MNKQQMHEAMQISRNFERVNNAAKIVSTALAEFRSVGSYFITDEQNKLLREADNIIDEIWDKSTEWEAGKYAANKLTENPAIT